MHYKFLKILFNLQIPHHSVYSSQPAVVSRFQKTIEERHKFQERLRLEAIEEAKYEIFYCR